VGNVILALLESITAFAATNVDDLVILMLFFAQVNDTFRPHHVVSGAYWGFVALVALSLIGFFGGLVVSPAWIGLLGILPILLGLRQLQQGQAAEEPAQVQTVNSDIPEATHPAMHPLLRSIRQFLHPQAYAVAAVTFANGGDNIGIYVPLFATSDAQALGVILVVFAVLKGVWCYGAYRLARQPKIAYALKRYGQRWMPWLLIALGIFIVWKNGTFRLLPGKT
jgi:cadmium resistance protein CadD (predicted permease)